MSHLFKRTAVAAALFPLLSATVFAQSQAQADEAAVIVTATPFSGGIGRALGAMVISAEDIARSTATTLPEVLDRLGGVTVRRNLNGSEDANLDLRGFGVTGSQNTLVLIDGQRVSENELAAARLSTIPLAAIERIEILRGGGAVLYGPGASGGVINIVTRAATGEGPRGYLFGLAGSLRTAEARAGFTVAQDGFGLALHASQRETDNWRENNANRTTAGSGEARIDLTQGFVALRFAADRQHARLPGARSEAQLATDPRGTATPGDHADSDASRVALAFEKKFGPIRLAADATTRRKDADFRFDQVAGPGTYMKNTTRGEEDAFTPRLVWQQRFGAASNALTIGGDWRDYRYRNDGRSDFGFGPTDSRIRSGQKNDAAYLQDQLSLSSGTGVSLGARRERIRQDWEETVTPLPRRSQERILNAWEAALRQEVGAGVALFVRGGKSFRVANVDENICFFAPCAALLEPQTARETAAGVEWKGGDNRLRAEVFDMDVDNEIYYNNLTFSNMNMPPLNRRGFTLDADWRPVDTVSVNAHYGQVSARFRRGSFFGVDVTDKEVPIVPRQRASLSMIWQFLPTTQLSLGWSHVGSQRYDNDPANRFRAMPAYDVVDLKLSHRWRDLTVNAGVNNLADKAYYAYALVNNSVAPTTFNAYPDLPRTAYVSAEIKF